MENRGANRPIQKISGRDAHARSTAWAANSTERSKKQRRRVVFFLKKKDMTDLGVKPSTAHKSWASVGRTPTRMSAFAHG